MKKNNYCAIKYPFFQYCDRKITLFSIAPHIVIAANLFYFGLLLLFGDAPIYLSFLKPSLLRAIVMYIFFSLSLLEAIALKLIANDLRENERQLET